MTLPKTLATAFAATATLALLPAAAQEVEETKILEVSIAEYDINDPADARAIVEKIEHAADKVCTVNRSPAPLRERMLKQRCADEAIAGAIESLDSEIVTAAFEETRSR